MVENKRHPEIDAKICAMHTYKKQNECIDNERIALVK